VFRIRGGEEIERDDVVDLLSELSRGAVAEDHIDTRSCFEGPGHFTENVRQIGGGGDC